MRYTKIVRRLKWKLPYLASSYQQATSRMNGASEEVDWARIIEAELMFKLDFFEYYMLLERALVHLLGIFGITVSRGLGERRLQTLRREQQRGQQGWSDNKNNSNGTADGNNKPPWRSEHRYHANVLEALDKEDNPLHEVLGTGDVRRQLSRAKDLRNRWKNADDSGPAPARNDKESAPLESYDLENIVTTIFEGFDRAYVIAEEYVPTEQRAVVGAVDSGERNRGSEEVQWEFMVDAMDWEAV
jgi:hypothetical protein